MKKKYLLVPALAGLMLTGCADYTYLETPDMIEQNSKSEVVKDHNVNDFKKELRKEIEACDASIDLNSPYALTYDSEYNSFESQVIPPTAEKPVTNVIEHKDLMSLHSEITINEKVIHEESDQKVDSSKILYPQDDPSDKRVKIQNIHTKSVRNEGLNDEGKLVITKQNDGTLERGEFPSKEEPKTETLKSQKVYTTDYEEKIAEHNYKRTYSWEMFSRLSFAILAEPFSAIDDHGAIGAYRTIRNNEENQTTYLLNYEISERTVLDNYERLKITTRGSYSLTFKDNLIYDINLDATNFRVYESGYKASENIKEHYVFSDYKDNEFVLDTKDYQETTNIEYVNSAINIYLPPIKDYVPKDKVEVEKKPEIKYNHYLAENYDTVETVDANKFKEFIKDKASKNQEKVSEPFLITNIVSNYVGDYNYDTYGALVSQKTMQGTTLSQVELNETDVYLLHQANETSIFGKEENHSFKVNAEINETSIKYKETKTEANKVSSSNETYIKNTKGDIDPTNNQLTNVKDTVIKEDSFTFVGDDITAIEFYEDHMQHNSTNFALRFFEVLDTVPNYEHELLTDFKLMKVDTLTCASILYTHQDFDKNNNLTFIKNYNYQMLFDGDDIMSVYVIESSKTLDETNIIHQDMYVNEVTIALKASLGFDPAFGGDFEITNKYINNLPDVKFDLPFKAK